MAQLKDPPAGRGHEFIEVRYRRWCLGCDLFQLKTATGEWPAPRYDCPWDTAYAATHPRNGSCTGRHRGRYRRRHGA